MRIVGLIVLAGGLLACGPSYRTEYTYTPPLDDRGRKCVADCNAERQDCRAGADARAEKERSQCEIKSNTSYYACLATAPDQKARDACVHEECRADPQYAACDGDFRTCFQVCGGTVTTQQVCTFNCD